MIKPHGSDELNPLFVYDSDRRHALVEEAESLPSILLNSAAAANAVMLAGGYFNPLTGYMNLTDALSVAERMLASEGMAERSNRRMARFSLSDVPSMTISVEVPRLRSGLFSSSQLSWSGATVRDRTAEVPAIRAERLS